MILGDCEHQKYHQLDIVKPQSPSDLEAPPKGPASVNQRAFLLCVNRLRLMVIPFPRAFVLRKTRLGAAHLRFPNRLIVVDGRVNPIARTALSQFLSVLLLVTTLTLTLRFGVAAWRQSASGDVDITAAIPHRETRLESKADGLEGFTLVLKPVCAMC